MKKIISLTMAIAMMAVMLVAATACATATPTATAPSEFKVGMECAYAPFNWTQTDRRQRRSADCRHQRVCRWL